MFTRGEIYRRSSDTASLAGRLSILVNVFIQFLSSFAAPWPPLFTLASANVDFYLFRLRFLGLGQNNDEDSILVGRLGLFGLDGLGQCQRPMEPAKKPLGTIGLSVVGFLLEFPLSGYRESAIVIRDFNFLPFHSGKLGFDREGVLVLVDVHGWRPTIEKLPIGV